MMAFLWHAIPHVSTHYHPGGSLLVIAVNLADAHNQILETIGAHCEALTVEPTRVWTVGDSSAREVFIFPDAGCC
jgi:hypothetical protein